jgi:hypothetical protein
MTQRKAALNEPPFLFSVFRHLAPVDIALGEIMVKLRSALIACCLLLAACAPAGKTSRGDISAPPPPTGESVGQQRNEAPINPPSDEARSNSTQNDRYSCRRSCDRDYSVCSDTAAARRDDTGRTRSYSATTCERQLNMCFTRCN